MKRPGVPDDIYRALRHWCAVRRAAHATRKQVRRVQVWDASGRCVKTPAAEDCLPAHAGRLLITAPQQGLCRLAPVTGQSSIRNPKRTKMMSIDWFRWYHGTVSDPKLALIAKKATQSRSTVIAVWAALLEHASQSEARGDVLEFDAETIAVALDIDDDVIRSILAAMIAKGMIADQRIAAWERRQPQRDDGAAERAKSWREKQKQFANAAERNRTKPNETERQEEEEEEEEADTDTDTEADTESSKKRAVGEKEEQRVAHARTHAHEPTLTRSSKTKNAPIKAAIPANWIPAETTYALLERHGIHRAFADECLDEFRLYWTERQEQRPGWESTFVNSVKRSWDRRTPTKTTRAAEIAEHNQRALEAWINQDANIIEGEIIYVAH